MSRVERLEWDSDFFDVPIGRIELHGASDRTIAEAEDEARDLGLLCLYAWIEPIEPTVTVRLQQLGYRFVEAATLFEVTPSEPLIHRPPGVDVRIGREDDIPLIQPMVDALADWSRFAVDPRFGHDAARRLQNAAVRRAARSTDDSFSLLLAESDDGVLAFVTRRREPHPTVDGVGTAARGSGAARYLIQVSREWAAPGSLLGGEIAARNIPALRYVSHCGYRVHRVRYAYHRWLDEDGGTR